jgi:Ca-activated chloride channel family protein
MLTFTTPWALLLLVLLPVTALAGYTRLRRLPGRRASLVLALRLLVLGLLVAALAGPAWRTTERRVAVMFLVDASGSMGPDGQRAGMTWAEQATLAAGPHDQAGMVLFGASPRLAVPLAHYKTLPDPTAPGADATDIGAAVRFGLSTLPPGVTGRLALLSDGRATTGDTNGALALALARGVPIDTVAITPRARRDTLVRAIDLPSTARVGERVPIRITLHSAYTTTATLAVSIDGATDQQTITLPAGDTVLRTEQRFDTRGVHTVRVRVDAPGDQVAANNTLDAATVVGAPGRVLLVVNDPASATGLASALARARMTVQPSLPSTTPTTAAAYRGYDEVVLDDVPATALTATQQRALRDATRAGLGLLAIGGPHSFSGGAYARSTLETALPVLSISTPRRVSAPLALMLVLDKSGSMADSVAGVAKVDMVKVAAASALDKLNDGDSVGVLAFDDTNHWIVNFHTVQGLTDKARIRAQINTLSADGDTYIYPALRDAEKSVLTVPTVYRHIVLLTDGQGEQDAPFDALIQRMRREHITLSTIGVGTDVQQDELQRWAKEGGGAFHYVADPHDIPRIVVNETRYGTTGNAQVKGRIKLGVAAASPLLRALSGQSLPSISAYDTTSPKATSQVSVQSAAGDPVLSSWQYGLGRAVAWTSDAGTQWAAAWSPARQQQFWVDAAHWAMRGPAVGAQTPQLSLQDGVLQVSQSPRTPAGLFDDNASPRVRVVMPDGTARVVALPLTAPGSYTAALPATQPGVYTASPINGDNQPAASDDIAAVVAPYPAEYASQGVDTAFLTHLSEASGGRVLTRPADAFAHDGLPDTVDWAPLWPALLLLALLLFPLDVALRLLLPQDAVYRHLTKV